MRRTYPYCSAVIFIPGNELLENEKWKCTILIAASSFHTTLLRSAHYFLLLLSILTRPNHASNTKIWYFVWNREYEISICSYRHLYYVVRSNITAIAIEYPLIHFHLVFVIRLLFIYEANNCQVYLEVNGDCITVHNQDVVHVHVWRQCNEKKKQRKNGPSALEQPAEFYFVFRFYPHLFPCSANTQTYF